jgi:hypothetical protein
MFINDMFGDDFDRAIKKIKEDSWNDGQNQWSSEQDQWANESAAPGQFNSKQEVINHFVKNGKSAAAGASAWERGWRGNTPKSKKPTGPVRNYHDDLDDKRYMSDDAKVVRKPLKTFPELADMLHISGHNLVAIISHYPGFPAPAEGVSARYGSRKYYDVDKFKSWVRQHGIHTRLKNKMGEATGDAKFDSMMGNISSPESLNTREALAMINDLVYHGGASYKEALHQASTSYEINPAKLHALYKQQEQGLAEGSLNEFAPGNGGGESGRWYTDDDMTNIVGDGWWQDLDISGDVSKQEMINEAQGWLLDQGYKVQVLNVKVNDDDCEWFIEGSFQNNRFAKKGVAEGDVVPFKKPAPHIPGYVFSGEDYFMDKFAPRVFKKFGIKIISLGAPNNDADAADKSATDYGHDESIREYYVDGDPKSIEAAGRAFEQVASMGDMEEAYGGYILANDFNSLNEQGVAEEPGFDTTDSTSPLGGQINENSDAVYGAIIRRIIGGHRSLISKYGIEAIEEAAREVADWTNIGPDDEIGSSDVSGWVRQVFQALSGHVPVNELSNDALARYKTAAGKAASAADRAGDYDKGHKRFKGIVKATNKQFANDMKKYKDK